MLPLLLLLPGWAEPPKAAELTPVPKVEPKPNDPIPLEANKYRVYSVQNYTGPVTWQVEGESVGMKEAEKALTLFGVVSGQTDPGQYDVPAGALIVWGKAPGLTKASAWGVVDGKAKLLLTLIFQVGPRPPPIDDKVDPKPVVGKLHQALVIEQSGAVWPTRGQVLVAFDTWCDANGVGRRWVYSTVVDASGQTPADLKPWIERGRNKPLPQIYLVTDKGGILFEGPCPQSAAELTALLAKYKGN